MRFLNSKYHLSMIRLGYMIFMFLMGAYHLPLADSAETPDAAGHLSSKGEILSLEKISAIAKKHKSGEILEVELEHKHGKYIYEVDILDQGSQVWELKLDAKSGQLLKIELDD